MPNITIKQACRVVCEGAADAAFFNSLIKVRKIANCEADCARLNTEPNRCAGKNGITDTLQGLKGYAEINPGKLRGVVVAIDVDTDPKQRLKETIEAIRAADLKSPTKYLEIRPRIKDDEFALAIIGVPSPDAPGNLDLLLFNAMADSHADVMRPLEDFCAATHARNGHWLISSKSKMRLRCTIAATYQDDPGLALSYLLLRHDSPIDLAHLTFNPIAAFLTDFETSTR
jgi:hypothetical protein